MFLILCWLFLFLWKHSFLVTVACKLKIFRKYLILLILFWFFRQRNLRNSAKFFGLPTKFRQIPNSREIQRSFDENFDSSRILAKSWNECLGARRRHCKTSCMCVFLVWRLMMGPGDACKTHDGARGCMQDPPAKLGTLLRCSCKGLGLHAIQGGLGYMYTCIWTSITTDMNIRHEHRLPQTWASYTHIRHEHRTSDMNMNIIHEREHQTWTWTSDMNIEHRTSTLHVHHTWTPNIKHEHRASDKCACMSVLNEYRFMYAGCMHTGACMHACATIFRPHELIPGCIMELYSQLYKFQTTWHICWKWRYMLKMMKIGYCSLQ